MPFFSFLFSLDTFYVYHTLRKQTLFITSTTLASSRQVSIYTCEIFTASIFTCTEINKFGGKIYIQFVVKDTMTTTTQTREKWVSTQRLECCVYGAWVRPGTHSLYVCGMCVRGKTYQPALLLQTVGIY